MICQKFYLFFLFFLFILSSFVQAANLGITPPSLELESSINKEVCGDFVLLIDDSLDEEISILFSSKPSKKVSDYVYSASDLDLVFSFDEVSYKDNRKSFDFCIIPSYSGDYSALILAKAKDSNFAVGMWLSLDIKGNNPIIFPDKISSVQSDERSSSPSVPVILNLESPKIIGKNSNSFWFIVSPFFLVIILVFLFYWYKKNLQIKRDSQA